VWAGGIASGGVPTKEGPGERRAQIGKEGPPPPTPGRGRRGAGGAGGICRPGPKQQRAGEKKKGDWYSQRRQKNIPARQQHKKMGLRERGSDLPEIVKTVEQVTVWNGRS